MVLKPQLSSRGCATKEAMLKPLLVATQTTKLCLCWWFPKFCTYRISKWATSAPAAEMELALATVGFVGFVGPVLVGLGQARVWVAFIIPTMDPIAWILQFWDLTSVDLSARSLHLPGCPWLHRDPEQCQHSVVCEPAQCWKGTH